MKEGNRKIKFDDEIKQLIIDALDGNKTGGGDIDALFQLREGFVVLEFLRCISVRPFNSHPNRYWNYVHDKIGNKNKFLALWNIAQKTNSKLFLVNYEDSREQFKIIEVKGLDEKRKIYDEVITKMDFDKFKKWFQLLMTKSI